MCVVWLLWCGCCGVVVMVWLLWLLWLLCVVCCVLIHCFTLLQRAVSRTEQHKGRQSKLLCHSHKTPHTDTRLHRGIAELLGRNQRVTFCAVRQRCADPCLSENTASRVTPPSQVFLISACTRRQSSFRACGSYHSSTPRRTPNFCRHRTLRLVPNFDRLRVCVGREASGAWSRLWDDSWCILFATAPVRLVLSSRVRCLRHAATSDSSQSPFISRQATETALYGRLSLLSKLLSPHFMTSMVSDGSVSECHRVGAVNPFLSHWWGFGLHGLRGLRLIREVRHRAAHMAARLRLLPCPCLQPFSQKMQDFIQLAHDAREATLNTGILHVFLVIMTEAARTHIVPLACRTAPARDS